LPCGFFLLFYSSPNLSGRRLDVYHTCTHDVALVRIKNAGLKRAARGSLKIQDAKYRQKVAIWAPSHNFVGLYLHNYSMYRQSEKSLLSSRISSTCPQNMVNFGPLAAEIVSLVWGTPAISLFGSVIARHYSSRHQPNFAALNRGRHLHSAERRSRWALAVGPHF